MRDLARASSKLFSLCLLLAGVGCGDPTAEGEEPTADVEEPTADVEVRQAALTVGMDSLAEYARKCDEATGIHVPAFNCDTGTEIPQSSATDLTTTSVNLDSSPSGSYLPSGTPVVMQLSSKSRDIQGTTDQAYYRYVAMDNLPTGTNGGNNGTDWKLEVKVTGFTPSSGNNSWAKAGLMFRNGATAANAPNVLLAVTPGQGVTFQHRSTAGGATTVDSTVAGVVAPVWLRLSRIIAANGPNTFTAFYSKDNRATWTKMTGSVTLSGIVDPTGGIAVTSHDVNKNITATFQQLTLPTACDYPNILIGKCDPGSRFKVVAQNDSATVVANCRKEELTADGFYGDIAVIQYNKISGAICYYQSQHGQDGRKATEPTKGTGAAPFIWSTPQATWAQGCTGCHDNGAFIRSPYLNQLASIPGANLLPGSNPGFDDGYGNSLNPLRYVGRDFAGARSWALPTGLGGDANCNGCHRLAANNAVNSGTAAHFSLIATGVTPQQRKNPYTETSPGWMPLGEITPQDWAMTSAMNYSECAVEVASYLTGGGIPPDPSCTWVGLGSALPNIAFQSSTNKLWITNGQGNTNIAMKPGTSPAIASGLPGTYLVAFAGSSGNLHLLDSDHSADTSTGRLLSSGTSPAITPLGPSLFEIAFQSGGTLWLMDSNGSPRNTNTPMKASTSPSITTLENGEYVVLFQHSNGRLWAMRSSVGVFFDTGLAMAAGTSPSVTRFGSSDYLAMLQRDTNEMWFFTNIGFSGSMGQTMRAGTSPSVTWTPEGDYVVAFQASNGELWLTGNSVQAHGLGLFMPANSSPSIFNAASGVDLAFRSSGGTLMTWTAGATSAFSIGLPIATGTSASIN